MATKPLDLTRTVLAVLSIIGLMAVSLLVLQPFLAATVWAATLVVATWPLMLRLQSALGGRRAPAAALMTLVLLFLVMLPLSMAISAIMSTASLLLDLPAAASVARIPPPPAWLSDIPLVGRPATEKWRSLAESSTGEIVQFVRPYVVSVTNWFLQAAGSFAQVVLHLLLTIGIAAILYAKGEAAAAWCRRFGRRLADERGEEVVVLAGQAIRGVALGVVVTALAQTLATGIALVAAGVPQAGLLTAVTLLLCIAQIGPILVVLPSIIWMFATDQTMSGIVLVVIGVPAVLMDNVLRPILIRRGADLPLLLILVGVIGGLFAFGVLGLFLGPVILAVTYTLLQHWVGETRDEETGGAAMAVKARD
jgi:predicted PurR-regulated permease PerM